MADIQERASRLTKALVFAPDSGNQYREFQREAKAYAKFLGEAEVLYFPVEGHTKTDARCFVQEALGARAGRDLDIVAFLNHGFTNGMQCGVDTTHAPQLANLVRAACKPSASVPLYACSTGKRFASILAGCLVGAGMEGGSVLSHWTAGHLSRNPDVRIFPICVGTAGADVLPLRDGRDGYARWRGFLHTPTGRWEAATMTHAECVAAAMRCEPYRG